MVRVIVEREAHGVIRGFSISGHAEFAEAGQDIVCAAVSAITQTAVLGLKEFGGTGMSCAIGAGRLWCRWAAPVKTLDPAWYIIETMLLGLNDIAQEHPEYVQLITQEV